MREAQIFLDLRTELMAYDDTKAVSSLFFFILRCLLEQCRRQWKWTQQKGESHEHIPCSYPNSKRIFR